MSKQLVRICPSDRFCRVRNLLTSSVELIWPITELHFRQILSTDSVDRFCRILSTDFLNIFYQDVKTGPLVFSRIELTTSELLIADALGYLLDYSGAECGTVCTVTTALSWYHRRAILLLSRRKNPHWPKFSKLNF